MSRSQQPVAEPAWFKSSYSGGNATECVEAAVVPAGVLLRDSKQPDGTRLAVSADAWREFLAVVIKG
ncbi:DUF397 domain-containing protein [Streptomyces argyrophyllae]|uniref:DUF397 domain-containing protein n=1 Tax=Streptomyces argyrophylli TaxID=2726118 RepID=A0A6M4PKZ0_9ACTN|nr:DUF397 domain-containing protein [Streptomyces argyrophyllae]QJS11731.1 DUF397 domain-containing protein [Streptomyces argyrophyllae]